MRSTRRFVGIAALVALAAACGDAEVSGPGVVDEPADPIAGHAAFVQVCAACHASRDGFDLAYFGFPASDVVRRAVAHVDSATARDIAAYIAELSVQSRGRDHRVFQPAGRLAVEDLEVWRERFGTTAWPANLTPASLAAIDLRDVAVSLAFPAWSSEADESDWLPEEPLPAPLLAADGAALAAALDDYYARNDMDALLHVIEVFDATSRDGGPMPDPVCAGTAGGHTHPVACFEARRWIASLAAVHLLRTGELRDVPHEIASIWWDVGEAGVTASFRGSHVTRRDAVAWLYLASIFSPDGFLQPGALVAEDAGYMGQFLVSEGLSRLALLVTLRRMVDNGPIHESLPLQAYRDLQLATLRSPRELRADVAEFGFGFLLDRTAHGQVPAGEAATQAADWVIDVLDYLAQAGGSGDAARDAAIRARADQLLDVLTPAAAPRPHAN